MNKIQIKTQKLIEELNIQELATLTIELWKITRPELNVSIEGLENWIKNLVYDEPTVNNCVFKSYSILPEVL